MSVSTAATAQADLCPAARSGPAMSPSRSSPAARSPTPRSTTRPAPPPSSGSGTTWRRTPPTTAACTAAPATSPSCRPTCSRTPAGRSRSSSDCRADDQLVFTRSTTDSLNLLAAALPADCQVFVFETEHHASLLPWQDAQVTYLDAPAHPAAGRRRPWSVPSPTATRTARPWSASPAPRTSPASCGRCASWPPPRTRTAPGSSSTPPSSPRTTRSPCGTSTSTGSPSPATSCTRRSAPACSPGRADWLREADPYLAGGGASRKVTRRTDGGVDVEWHDTRRPARGRLAERHRRLLHRRPPARRSPRPGSTRSSPASSS